jgi:hypothetical protein
MTDTHIGDSLAQENIDSIRLNFIERLSAHEFRCNVRVFFGTGVERCFRTFQFVIPTLTEQDIFYAIRTELEYRQNIQQFMDQINNKFEDKNHDFKQCRS